MGQPVRSSTSKGRRRHDPVGISLAGVGMAVGPAGVGSGGDGRDGVEVDVIVVLLVAVGLAWATIWALALIFGGLMAWSDGRKDRKAWRKVNREWRKQRRRDKRGGFI